MQNVRLFLTRAAIFLALFLSAKSSRADLTEAAYSDVRDIIEELLTAEISETIVPQLACQARRIPVPAPLDSNGNPLPVDSPDYPRTVVTWLVNDGSGPRVQAYDLFALHQFPRSLQRVYSRQFGSLKGSITEESADYAAYVAYQALIGGDPSVVDKTVGKGELTAAAKAQFVPLTTPEAINDCVSTVAKRFKAGAFQSRVPTPLESACVGQPNSYSCEIAFAIRAAILGKASVAQEQLLRATGELVTEAIAHFLPKAGIPVPVAQIPKVREFVMQAVREILSEPNKSPLAIITTLEQDLKGVLCPAPGCALDIHTRLGEVLGRLRLQWSLASADGTSAIDLASYATVFFSADSALDELCNSPDHAWAPVQRATGLCNVFRKAKNVLSQAGTVFPIIRAAAQHDTREVAHLAMAAIFKSGCAAQATTTDAKCGSEQQKQNELYRRFAETVAVYVIDSADGSTPSDGTRAAFKSAAVDLIREVSGPNGLSRMWYTPLWIPSFALRAAWSPGFVNRDSSSLRYVASVNWVGIRPLFRYTNLTYVGLDISTLDLIAPASEIALRDNTNAEYDHKGRVAANVLSPRLDLLIGIPALSTHLVVGAGVAIHPVATVRTLRTVEDGIVFSKYDYRWINDDKATVGRFVDFGFFAKYLL